MLLVFCQYVRMTGFEPAQHKQLIYSQPRLSNFGAFPKCYVNNVEAVSSCGYINLILSLPGSECSKYSHCPPQRCQLCNSSSRLLASATKFYSAGVPGLEPRIREPKSPVLPITPYPKVFFIKLPTEDSNLEPTVPETVATANCASREENW